MTYNIVSDQHNGVEVKHNEVNVENNRQSLLEFLNSIIGQKNVDSLVHTLRACMRDRKSHVLRNPCKRVSPARLISARLSGEIPAR